MFSLLLHSLWVKRMRRRITTGWPWPCIQQLLLPVIIYLYYTLFDTWNPLIIFTLFPLDNLVCYERDFPWKELTLVSMHTQGFLPRVRLNLFLFAEKAKGERLAHSDSLSTSTVNWMKWVGWEGPRKHQLRGGIKIAQQAFACWNISYL